MKYNRKELLSIPKRKWNETLTNVMGVYVIPSGRKEFTANTTADVDISGYATARVSVPVPALTVANIEENGTSYAPEGHAYDTVKVNVKPKLLALTGSAKVTANKTYKASNYKDETGKPYEGFSEVEVAVPVSDLTVQTKEITFTANTGDTPEVVTYDSDRFDALEKVRIFVKIPEYDGTFTKS